MTAPDVKKRVEEVSSQCLGFHAIRAARVLARGFDQGLRPLGISIGQHSMLMAVARGAGSSISRLAEVLGLDRTTLTRNLRVMERNGLLKLSNEGPRRIRSVELTEEGEAMILKAYPIWRASQDRMIEAIGSENAELARGFLKSLSRLEAMESRDT